jgi:hypothetical protein
VLAAIADAWVPGRRRTSTNPSGAAHAFVLAKAAHPVQSQATTAQLLTRNDLSIACPCGRSNNIETPPRKPVFSRNLLICL